MKLLKIEGNIGQFLSKNGTYQEIDKITKDDLLYLVECILNNSDDLEPYDEDKIRNQAHQVVYKSIYNNLKALEDRKQEFVDNSERFYLEDYKRYMENTPQQDSSTCMEGSGPKSG